MKNLWLIGRAFVMAAWGHRKQRDKAGKRYIWHLVRVAWIAYGLEPSAKVVVVALLHDYLEDVDPNAAKKLCRRFGYPVAAAVQDLTRDQGTRYKDYIRHVLIFGYGYAQIVKLADLLHNTQPSRLPILSMHTDAMERRGTEYLDAIEALTRQRVMRSWGVR